MKAGASIVLAVLGGSSPATPVLVEALRRAQCAGSLGDIEMRLYGRNSARLERIREYSLHAARAPCADAETSRRELSIVATDTLAHALSGASQILCMVRPGGMAGRAADESFARSFGAIADEGLGVGGLRCHLRGRELMESIAQACARHAPRADLLQMSSPLGLNVASSRAAFGERAIGVCELPRTTARRLAQLAADADTVRWTGHSHAGLNHQSWLYDFRDARGADVTAGVLAGIPADAGLGVRAETIQELGAVPVHYLRMYLDTERLTADQQRGAVRGLELEQWSSRVEQALCANDAPEVERVSRLLAERRMDWFDEGIVPVLAALQGDEPVQFTLNVPAGGAMPDAPADAIVEIDCDVSKRGVSARRVPPLPGIPARLTRQLLSYERAVLALPADPDAQDLAAALAEHPLTPRGRIRELADSLASLRPEPVELR
jgi:6-phospho-beta-glucosidase